MSLPASACEASYSVGGLSSLTTRPSCSTPGKGPVVKIAARKAMTARLTCPATWPPARFTTPADRVLPAMATRAAPPGVC